MKVISNHRKALTKPKKNQTRTYEKHQSNMR